ncbi:MAG: LVIVD repeat-containing protein [Actinomycetes bacterium]
MRRRALLATAVAVALPAGLAAVQTDVAPIATNVRHVAHVPGEIGGHVNVEGDVLVAGGFGVGMAVYDISDRTTPKLVGEWAPTGGRSDAVPDAITDGTKLVASLSGNRSGWTNKTEFLDITDPKKIVKIGELTGTDGNDHTGDFVDERMLWVPAGGPKLRLYDATPLFAAQPTVPSKIGEWDLVTLWRDSPHRRNRPTVQPFTHVHEITVHTDVFVDRDNSGTEEEGERRDLALVAEGGAYGFTPNGGNIGSTFVVDITDPADPVVLNRFRLEAQKDAASWHPIRYYHEARLLDADQRTMIISDEDLHSGCQAGGLHTVRMSPDFTDSTIVSEWFNGTGTPAGICSVHNFTTEGTLAYVGSYNAGLQVVDFADPAKPVRVGQYIIPGADSWGAQIHDGYVYVGDLGGRGLDVFEYIPDAVAEGFVASNPATTQVSGISETLCEQGVTGAPTGDALIVEIPASVDEVATTIRATGSGTTPYDLNVYFYDENCSFMGGTSINADGRDAEGPVPPGARFGAVTSVGINVLGEPPVPAARQPVAPVYVRAQLLQG